MDDVQPKAIAAALPAVTSDFILAKMFNALVWPTSRKSSTSGRNPATRSLDQLTTRKFEAERTSNVKPHNNNGNWHSKSKANAAGREGVQV